MPVSELAALAKNSDEAQTRSIFEQECQRLTEVLLKRETRIKEIIEVLLEDQVQKA